MRLTVLLSVLLGVGTALASSSNLQDARSTPAWFTQGVMYQIQPRAFTPEGTLKAAEAKLPYLKELGVTIAYLVPVFRMDDDMDQSFWSPRQVRSGFNNPKNQYRISDYYHVDSEYGTDADLLSFVTTAHKLGMKVLFDLVYYHAGPTSPIFRRHPEFTWWNEDGTISKGGWRFPQFNFECPGVKEYLWNNMVYHLVEFGADGYRCDVGDAIPLDFWYEGHRRMDTVSKGEAILLCEGYDEQNQVSTFDADYGWFPAEALTETNGAVRLRQRWEYRELMSARGAKFVNHYENHDIATDLRPRREAQWGTAAVDQVLVWMFTLDGIPMLFTGNEIADADPKHSMFGKSPMDWSQLGREPGKSRHALVTRLARIRREHAAFTELNGRNGLSWLDVKGSAKVGAFVRRDRAGNQVVVVQNWGKEAAEVEIGFAVKPDPVPDYLSYKAVDRSVKGRFAEKPLLARAAERTGERTFRLGPYGYSITEIKQENK